MCSSDLDFDDARTGPAVQDLWMLLSGERAAMTRQLGWVLAGYEQFREFHRTHYHPSNARILAYGDIPTRELLGFPVADHDDMVDALVYAHRALGHGSLEMS